MKKICLFGSLIVMMSYAQVHDRALIKSYDTTYHEGSNKFRQIYINDNKTETYILIRNDSVILYDIVSIKDDHFYRVISSDYPEKKVVKTTISGSSPRKSILAR